MEGRLAKQSNGNAARYFSKACELRDESGCTNVAVQYHFLRERRSDGDVARALEMLERDCLTGSSGRNCFLVGFAYESGHGRPLDKQRAREIYAQSGPDDLYAVKGIARIALSTASRSADLAPVAKTLERAAEAGDAESCWYLGYMHHGGYGVARDTRQARTLIERACSLGSKDACAALKHADLPPYADPILDVPTWSSPFPVPLP
jgi:TPR repeat protein